MGSFGGCEIQAGSISGRGGNATGLQAHGRETQHPGLCSAMLTFANIWTGSGWGGGTCWCVWPVGDVIAGRSSRVWGMRGRGREAGERL